jgi:hypothetical protein
MYILIIALLLLVFPICSILVELFVLNSAVGVWLLIGKWFVFWAVGVRLFIAGLRQITQPEFTANKIFGIKNPDVFAIVREIGFSNLSMGLLGLWSIYKSEWVMPAALVGGLYYGLAGVGHLFKKQKNLLENIAMYSDFFIFIILLIFFVSQI